MCMLTPIDGYDARHGLFRRSMGRGWLQREGTPGDGTIIDIRYTNSRTTYGPVFAVKLAIRAPDGAVFEIDAKIDASMVNPPVPGQVIPVRYDPGHPSNLIWDEEEANRRHQQVVENRREQIMRDAAD